MFKRKSVLPNGLEFDFPPETKAKLPIHRQIRGLQSPIGVLLFGAFGRFLGRESSQKMNDFTEILQISCRVKSIFEKLSADF
jgi:hypothetical protein